MDTSNSMSHLGNSKVDTVSTVLAVLRFLAPWGSGQDSRITIMMEGHGQKVMGSILYSLA